MARFVVTVINPTTPTMAWLEAHCTPRTSGTKERLRVKWTGPCPVFRGRTCTDVTGRHHSTVVDTVDVQAAIGYMRPNMYVVRVEEV